MKPTRLCSHVASLQKCSLSALQQANKGDCSRFCSGIMSFCFTYKCRYDCSTQDHAKSNVFFPLDLTNKTRRVFSFDSILPQRNQLGALPSWVGLTFSLAVVIVVLKQQVYVLWPRIFRL